MHLDLINVVGLTCAVVALVLAAAALWTLTKPAARSSHRQWPRGRRRVLLCLVAGILVCSPLLIGFIAETIIDNLWSTARALNFPNAQYWRGR